MNPILRKMFAYILHGASQVVLGGRGASLVAQLVKNLPAMQETQVGSLGQEDPLQEGMATHSNFRVWRIPRTVEPGGLLSMGLQRVRQD